MREMAALPDDDVVLATQAAQEAWWPWFQDTLADRLAAWRAGLAAHPDGPRRLWIAYIPDPALRAEFVALRHPTAPQTLPVWINDPPNHWALGCLEWAPHPLGGTLTWIPGGGLRDGACWRWPQPQAVSMTAIDAADAAAWTWLRERVAATMAAAPLEAWAVAARRWPEPDDLYPAPCPPRAALGICGAVLAGAAATAAVTGSSWGWLGAVALLALFHEAQWAAWDHWVFQAARRIRPSPPSPRPGLVATSLAVWTATLLTWLPGWRPTFHHPLEWLVGFVLEGAAVVVAGLGIDLSSDSAP